MLAPAMLADPWAILPVECRACGGKRFRLRLAGDGFAVQECAACRLGHTMPHSHVTSSDYNSVPSFAEGYASVEASSRVYASMMLDWLRPFVPSGRLLDVGCSVGVLVEAASERGFAAEGIDLDGNAIAYGQGKGRALFQVPVQEWSGGPYNAICLQHTLEHIQEPEPFLAEIRRLLAPDGCAIISVPCHDGMHPRIFGKRWYGWQCRQHFYHYSRPAMRMLLERTGFVVKRCYQNSMDHRMRGPASSLRALVKARLMHAMAVLGAAAGRGDQLVAVVCRRGV